jgi:hypothetical protein
MGGFFWVKENEVPLYAYAAVFEKILQVMSAGMGVRMVGTGVLANSSEGGLRQPAATRQSIIAREYTRYKYFLFIDEDGEVFGIKYFTQERNRQITRVKSPCNHVKYIFEKIMGNGRFPKGKKSAQFTPENRAPSLYAPDTNNFCENSAKF